MRTIIALLDIESAIQDHPEHDDARQAIKGLHAKNADVWFITNKWKQPLYAEWKKDADIQDYLCICKAYTLTERITKPRHWPSKAILHFLEQGYIRYPEFVHAEQVFYFAHSEEDRQKVMEMNNPNVRVFSSVNDLSEALSEAQVQQVQM